MEDLIQRLDTWLKKNRPEYYDYLLPGLSELELSKLEQTLGVELPTEFKLLYQWKNGQIGQEGRLIPNLEWYNAKRIINSSRITPLIEEDGLINWTAEMWQKDKAHKWVTFLTDSTANEYILDLAGLFDGKKGQIICFWSDDNTNNKISHESFYKWFETIVVAYESNFLAADIWDTILEDYIDYQAYYKANNPGYPIEIRLG